MPGQGCFAPGFGAVAGAGIVLEIAFVAAQGCVAVSAAEIEVDVEAATVCETGAVFASVAAADVMVLEAAGDGVAVLKVAAADCAEFGVVVHVPAKTGAATAELEGAAVVASAGHGFVAAEMAEVQLVEPADVA